MSWQYGTVLRLLWYFSLCVLPITKAARILPYSFQAYNDLLNYREARLYALDHVTIYSLGETFTQYGVNDTLGLCLLHNHFHLLPGEVMVEVVHNTSSTTEPHTLKWEFADGGAQDIVPSMMAVSTSGYLTPFELLDLSISNFAAYSKTIRSNVKRLYAELASFDGFFQALARKLEEFQLLHVFGVCIRHRDSITSADPGQSSMEMNHPKQRWLRLDPLMAYAHKMDIINAKWMKGEATATFWSFPMRCECGLEGSMCAECGCSNACMYCAECSS